MVSYHAVSYHAYSLMNVCCCIGCRHFSWHWPYRLVLYASSEEKRRNFKTLAAVCFFLYPLVWYSLLILRFFTLVFAPRAAQSVNRRWSPRIERNRDNERTVIGPAAEHSEPRTSGRRCRCYCCGSVLDATAKGNPSAPGPARSWRRTIV